MSDRFTEQLLILSAGVGWSLLFFLGKRMLQTIDNKIENALKKIESAEETVKEIPHNYQIKIDQATKSMARGLARRVEKQCETCNRMFVTRQEFGAFTATINYKIDSIYQLLKIEGTKKV